MRAAVTVLPQADVLWVAYVLYSPDARWDEELPDVIRWGATILQTKEALDQDLGRLFKPD
jgi:hypothetical protein